MTLQEERAAILLPENNQLIIQPGKTYQCKNGAFVTISNEVNNSLYYKYKASNVIHEYEGIRDSGYQEVWAENGNAYHYDCGWNIVRTGTGQKTCTRPDVLDCHARNGTGGFCMNIMTCPPKEATE